MDKAVVELLELGKTRLETEGWVQYASHIEPNKHYKYGLKERINNRFFGGPDKSGYCATGAVLLGPEPLFLKNQAMEYLNDVKPGVTSWNDSTGRKKKEVLDLYDKAIALAKEDI